MTGPWPSYQPCTERVCWRSSAHATTRLAEQNPAARNARIRTRRVTADILEPPAQGEPRGRRALLVAEALVAPHADVPALPKAAVVAGAQRVLPELGLLALETLELVQRALPRQRPPTLREGARGLDPAADERRVLAVGREQGRGHLALVEDAVAHAEPQLAREPVVLLVPPPIDAPRQPHLVHQVAPRARAQPRGLEVFERRALDRRIVRAQQVGPRHVGRAQADAAARGEALGRGEVGLGQLGARGALELVRAVPIDPGRAVQVEGRVGPPVERAEDEVAVLFAVVPGLLHGESERELVGGTREVA